MSCLPRRSACAAWSHDWGEFSHSLRSFVFPEPVVCHGIQRYSKSWYVVAMGVSLAWCVMPRLETCFEAFFSTEPRSSQVRRCGREVQQGAVSPVGQALFVFLCGAQSLFERQLKDVKHEPEGNLGPMRLFWESWVILGSYVSSGFDFR